MIDWVTAILPLAHREPIRGGRLISVTSEGEIEWQQVKSHAVVGSHESNLHVQTVAPNLVRISGNPVKWLQGHNLFGSEDLLGLVSETMRRLSTQLRLVPALSDYRAWDAGDYELYRVDSTMMWALPRREDVRAWLRAIEARARSRHGRAVARGGTVYFGMHSRRWALKFYSKGDELADRGKGHKLPEEIMHRDLLLAFADDKLRGELTLRRPELIELKFERASAWFYGCTLWHLYDYIGKVQMSDQFSLTTEILESLPPRLRLVYEAWKNGKDMRQMLPLRTYYRYRKELLAHGIDIRIQQAARPDNVIPLVHALQPKAIAPVPEWAVGTSLFFDPPRKDRAKR